MSLPTLHDIAVPITISIDEKQKLKDAVDIMYQNNILDIIVIHEGEHHYGLITANDLIRFKMENIDFDSTIQSLQVSKISVVNNDTALIDVYKEIQRSCHRICITNEKKELCGVATYSDIIGSIDPAILIQEQKIKEILGHNTIKQVNVTTQTADALRMMSNDLHDSVIIYDDDQPVGIITTKDTIRLLNKDSDLRKSVSHYMSAPIRSINETASVQETLDFIQKENFKRVIISNKEGHILGQISQEELLSKIYSRWEEGLKHHGEALEKVNKDLEARASKFEEMAQVDTLTGLANRSRFEKTLISEFERIDRHGVAPFSLVFFDIDHFKKVNDTYGHLVGDQVLRSISTQCKSLLRKNDTLARWGGEEFVIILPMVNVDGAYEVAEKLRKHIEEYIFEQVGNITCSFGVSQYQKSDTIKGLLHRTDCAMYEAKNSGRNCIVVQ